MMTEFFSAYMDPADLAAAELVTTDTTASPISKNALPAARMTVFVSYVPRLKSFSAHKEGLGEIRGSSMNELLSKLAELWPNVEFTLVLSKVAKAEVAHRHGGTPRAVGWS